VAIDDHDRPLGVLELHLLHLVALVGNMMLAFLLVGRCAVVARLLLLLLAELLYELLDLLALLEAVAPGVVHRAPGTALVATGGLLRPLVAAWAMTPTNHCSNSGSGSTCQWLVIVVGLLLLPIPILATALSRLGMPCTPLCSPSTLVC
jgi:hypothetical protein